MLSLRTGHMDSRVALVPGVPAGYRSAHTIAKLLAT
nr:hypothetical protein [Saccharomonospora piscinae]